MQILTRISSPQPTARSTRGREKAAIEWLPSSWTPKTPLPDSCGSMICMQRETSHRVACGERNAGAVTMSIRRRGVLVIDNDAAGCGSIVRKLVGDGIRADVAQNASDAIRLRGEARYEVVALDWQLPDGAGGRVVSNLQQS